MNLIEWLAAGLGLMGVLLGLAQRTGVWILWIGSSALYLVLYAQVALWGQVGLMVVFIVVSLWGFFRWRAQARALAAGEETQPRWYGVCGLRRVVLIGLAAWLLLGVALGRTDNPHAWLDSWVTTTSLLAMWLMAQRRLDCWVFWAVANGSAVALFMQQGLWATTLLYALQLILSFVGLVRWQQSVQPMSI
jgi:nicotinamide mononucleotide transporter